MQFLLVLTLFGPIGFLVLGAMSIENLQFHEPFKALEPFFIEHIWHKHEKAAALTFFGGCAGLWRVYLKKLETI